MDPNNTSSPPPPAYYAQKAPPSGYPMNSPAYTTPSYVQPEGYSTQTTVVQPNVPQSNIVVVGGCPNCRVGVMQDEFTFCGICCAVFCFPIGLLCLFLDRDRRCSNCGASFK